MATYRQIKPSIYDDPDFLEYSPEYKLFFIYSFTNKSVSESGIYPISLKKINFDLGLPIDVINQAMHDIKNIVYDYVNKCIFVVNFRKHCSIGGSPKLLTTSVKNSFISTHKSPLWHLFVKLYPEYETVIKNGLIPFPEYNDSYFKDTDKLFNNPLQTVDKPLDKLFNNPLQTVDKPLDFLNPLERVDKGLSRNRSSNSNSSNTIDIGNTDNIGNITSSKEDEENLEFSSTISYKENLQRLKKYKNKTAFLVDAFKHYHSDAPNEELANERDIYKNMSILLNKAGKDYGYVFKCLHETITASIDGYHFKYLMGYITGTLKDKKKNQVQQKIDGSFIGKKIDEVDRNE